MLLRHLLLTLATLACAIEAVHAAPAQNPPNIVLMMADDMGWGDPQCFHADSPISTPNLDAMCKRGIQFTRFYAAAPVCSPTRGACLTGRNPYRYGITTANRGHLRAGEICLAEVLRKRGYATGHFGKWHLGTLLPDYSGKGPRRKPRENYCTPGMRGFDEWFSTEFAVATWDPYDPENSHVGRGIFEPRSLYWHNGRNVSEKLEGCDSRIIVDRAVPFMENCAREQRPFLAVIWFHAPHAPVVGGPEYRARYKQYSESQQHYYAVVTALDEQVGRVRETLRAAGVAQNTMLWFCSDNGPEGNPQAKGRSQGSAGPFRGRKRSLYEGGVRVPGILEWPDRVTEPRVCDVPCVTTDYFPTVLDVLGSKDPPATRPYDGQSLLGIIDGQVQQRTEPIAFQFGSQAALTGQRYKLVKNASTKKPRSDNGSEPTAEYELYDLIEDPSETRNLAARHPERVASMRKQLAEWQASCRASSAGKDYAIRP